MRPAISGEWSQRRLRLTLVTGLGSVAMLAVGFGFAVYHPLFPSHQHTRTGLDPTASSSTPSSAATTPVAASAQQRRDAIAAAPMPTVALDDATPGPLSARDPGILRVPRSNRVGPAGVPTGYPQTPEGAVAQLAAIDQAALQSAALPGVRAVIAAWAAPGGPIPDTWSGTKAMTGFLSAAGLGGGGDPDLSIVVTPSMGLIKGTVGDDYVVACVDFTVQATLNQTYRVAAADCQRMVWTGGRWVIGPGPEPAPAPAVWPDTNLAIRIGYRDLSDD